MVSLDDRFKDLRAQLGQPATLNPAKSDPIFYFVYPAEQMLELKRRIPIWTAQLRNDGFDVQRISLSDLLWQLVDESGRYEAWLDIEAGADVGYIRVSQLMKCPDEACFIAVSTYLTGYATGSESVQEPTVR